jgi:hypothetical protein
VRTVALSCRRAVGLNGDTKECPSVRWSKKEGRKTYKEHHTWLVKSTGLATRPKQVQSKVDMQRRIPQLRTPEKNE